MNVVTYRLSLDMLDTLSQRTIKAKKGDSACKIQITLTKHGKVFQLGEGCYATFNAKKSDGNFIYDNCTIEGNTIVYDFATSIDDNGVCQISAIEGNVDCEVTVYNANGEQLTSPRFTLYIDSVVYNGEEIASSSEGNVLRELIKEAEEAIDSLGDVLTNEGNQEITNGSFIVNDDNAQNIGFKVTRNDDDEKNNNAAMFLDENNNAVFYKGYDGSRVNQMIVSNDKTTFTKPIYYNNNAVLSQTELNNHNVDNQSHNDIRLLISSLTTQINALLDCDDTTLDQTSEIVEYIKSNKGLIDNITTSKVNVADIIDNLATNVSNQPLSAAQGVELKKLVDELETYVDTELGKGLLKSSDDIIVKDDQTLEINKDKFATYEELGSGLRLDFVKYNGRQELTEEQRETARENIGAVDSTFVFSLLSSGFSMRKLEDVYTSNLLYYYDPAEYEEKVIYLTLQDGEEESGNCYDEVIIIDGKWEIIGSTKVDLSGYATKEEVKVPHSVRIKNFNGSTVEVGYFYVDGGEDFRSITLDLNEDKSETVCLYKIYIDDEVGFVWNLFENEPENPFGRMFAFDYTVENGKVTYLSTDGVNYLLEAEVEKKADKENDFELIHEETLTEEQQFFSLTDLNLIKARIWIVAPIADNTASGYVRIQGGSVNSGSNKQVGFVNNIITTQARETFIEIKKENGSIGAEWLVCNASGHIGTVSGYSRENDYLETTDNIKSIHVISTSSTYLFPVGTTFVLKGVKA